MEVRVLREACCAQEDQLGPLEARYVVSADASFEELVAMIRASRFLQYSSSHTTLQGEVAGVPVVRVFNPHGATDTEARFHVPASRSVAEVVQGRPLSFRFVFD